MTVAGQDEVLVSQDGRVARLTLNRPKALHALTEAMCATMTRALLTWRDDPAITLVMIDHAGERGFCAGGDIRMLARSGQGDGEAARSFFKTEYRLNHLLFTYPKPVAAFMDGVVMGGGAGVALPCRYRVATENTIFAMPETGIGLFPDVGGGWHLPRLPGETGLWLALTGARLKTADCLALGLASHAIAAASLPVVKTAILANPEAIGTILVEAALDVGPAPLRACRTAIDTAFSGSSVEEIVSALETGDAWSRGQAEILAGKSPQALKVAFRQLTHGREHDDFTQTLAMEYRVGARLVHRHDFQQGVRAVIVVKDNDPRWAPSSLADVPDALLDQIFAPLPADQEWTPLVQGALT
ncbi:enoyl-CoA hydratase/isomerase family protein [Caulobacter sp. BK020]|uniref:enoyl-CoA hydratase/isomerase family protein n=1 Tax=Caulobacter sp. BK020 TaxID=2512117 RepID=UPI0010434C83|nr:enoyl-CoA hydratase/isomerase family protein [Caulobacter sp. BK020]TCS15306.1 enoyl-CoA hydratase [Caulobacter sp. BK020]